MAKAATNRQDIHAARDQHRGVRMAQTVQRNPRHAYLGHNTEPRLREPARAQMLAVRCGKHGSAVRRLPKAYPEALLLLFSPMLTQLRYKMLRQRDRPAPALGLGPLSSDPVGGGL